MFRKLVHSVGRLLRWPVSAEASLSPVSGVLRDHLAVLEAAKQRAAVLRARSGQAAASSGPTAASSTPPISGVLRDYLATKQAALARQLDTSAGGPAMQGEAANSTLELGTNLAASPGPSTGVLRDYIATVRARQTGQGQQSMQTPASTSQATGDAETPCMYGFFQCSFILRFAH